MFHKTNLKKYFRNDVNFILKGTKRAKTSRQIWIMENDGKEVNTKLRLRLHLNNDTFRIFMTVAYFCPQKFDGRLRISFAIHLQKFVIKSLKN